MPDFRKIADIIVNKCLWIKEGEVVNLAGGIHTMELFEEVYIAIRKAGGFVVPLITVDGLEKRILTEVPLHYLARLSPHRIPMLEFVSASIAIGDNEDPMLLADIPEENLSGIRNALTPLRIRILDRKKEMKYRTLYIGFPTEKGAARYGIPYQEYSEIFWRAVDIDFEVMRKREQMIADLLAGRDRIRITDPSGTDIEFSIKGRTPLLDGGILTLHDLKQGNTNVNLPCGEVWIAPLEDSAKGVAVFPTVFHQGRRIDALRLTFERGRIASIEAKKNEKLFRDLLKSSSGDHDVIGEFGVGCNPEVTRICGDNLLDEKMWGTVHIAIGSNEFFGGKNRSPIHKDMIILKPSVWVDGRQMLEEGALIEDAKPVARG